MARTINKLLATIGAGQPLSNVVDTANNHVVGIIMPPAWTNAHVTALVSLDSTNFYDLFSYGETGTTLNEFRFNVMPGAIAAINYETLLMARYIRLRSGTRAEPIAQLAARTFTVITVNQVSMSMLPAPEGNDK